MAKGGSAERLTFEQKSEEIKEQSFGGTVGSCAGRDRKPCKGPEAGVSLNTAAEEAQADNVDLGVVDLQEAFKTIYSRYNKTF